MGRKKKSTKPSVESSLYLAHSTFFLKTSIKRPAMKTLRKRAISKPMILWHSLYTVKGNEWRSSYERMNRDREGALRYYCRIGKRKYLTG